jgi:hypothetical protein
MNHSNQTSTLSRREALKRTLLGSVVVCSVSSVGHSKATTVPSAEPHQPFIPENDYPFFGGPVPDGYAQ